MPVVDVTWTKTFYQYYRAYSTVEELSDDSGGAVPVGFDMQGGGGGSGRPISSCTVGLSNGHALPTDFSGVTFTPSSVPAGDPHDFAGTITYPATAEWEGVSFKAIFHDGATLPTGSSGTRIWTARVLLPTVNWQTATLSGRTISFHATGNNSLGSPASDITEFEFGYGGFTDTVTATTTGVSGSFYADWSHTFSGGSTIVKVRCKNGLGQYSPWKRLSFGPIVLQAVDTSRTNVYKSDASISWDVDGSIAAYEWRVYPHSPFTHSVNSGIWPTLSVLSPSYSFTTIDSEAFAYNYYPATATGANVTLDFGAWKIAHVPYTSLRIELTIRDNEGNFKVQNQTLNLNGHDLAVLCDRFSGEISAYQDTVNFTDSRILIGYVNSTLTERAQRAHFSYSANPCLWHRNGTGTEIGLCIQSIADEKWRVYLSKDFGSTFSPITGSPIVWDSTYGFADVSGTRDAIDITAAVKLSTRAIYFKHSIEPSGWSPEVQVGIIAEDLDGPTTVRIRQKWECGSSQLVLYAANRRWISKDLGVTWTES